MKRLLLLAAVLVFAVPASATTSRILAPADLWPVWSPDGTHIAFTRAYPNHMELWVLNTGTHRGVHIGTNAGQLGPTWSSDGKRLAYSSGGILYTANADGRGKARYIAPVRAYAPAWRPGSNELAYLTTKGATNTDLWVSGVFWAPNVIGTPAWSPDAKQLAALRDDGIYLLTGPGTGRRLVAVANPRSAVWSPDGSQIAYIVGRGLYVVTVPGGKVRQQTPSAPPGSVPSWSRDGGTVIVSGAWSPTGNVVVSSGPKPGCPGHTVLREGTRALTGTCVIAGTQRADVIEGTRLWGDVIRAGAGNDQVHANDRHTDRVDCGTGRDVVWADRRDRLVGCEIVHR